MKTLKIHPSCDIDGYPGCRNRSKIIILTLPSMLACPGPSDPTHPSPTLLFLFNIFYPVQSELTHLLLRPKLTACCYCWGRSSQRIYFHNLHLAPPACVLIAHTAPTQRFSQLCDASQDFQIRGLTWLGPKWIYVKRIHSFDICADVFITCYNPRSWPGVTFGRCA